MTWLATLGRVLAAFGLGVLAMTFYPRAAAPLGIPLAFAGVLAMLVGGRLGARRERPAPPPDAGA
jgi:hypothetical protein